MMRIETLKGKSIFENDDIKWFLLDNKIWISKYENYAQIESKLGDFLGSFNWLYELNDTLLFDKENGRLQTAIIDLVRKVNIDYSQHYNEEITIDEKVDMCLCDKKNQNFEFPSQVFYSEMHDILYSFGKEHHNQKISRAFIVDDFGFYLVDDLLNGWILKNASKHIFIEDAAIEIDKAVLVKFIQAMNLLDTGDYTGIKSLLEFFKGQSDSLSLVLRKALFELL